MLKSLPLLAALAFATPLMAQAAAPAQATPDTAATAATPPADTTQTTQPASPDAGAQPTPQASGTTTGAGVPAPTTEEEARTLLQSQGYTKVTGVSRQADGSWHARATKDGKAGHVMIGADGSVKPK